MVALALASLSVVALEGVRHCGFVSFDDAPYVYRNPHLRDGLSAAGLQWAWSADLTTPCSHIDYWSPMTAMSRLVDVQLFGLDAAGHHLVNLVLHALSVALLFLVLEEMTGRFWPSAFVAAVFGVHPLHVESVAWVVERKDVLSGLFFVMSLGAYAAYARSPGAARFLGVIGFFTLALLSKPMVMTLPFVLLLIDYWPLGRLRANSGSVVRELRPLVVEKLPLLLLTALSCAATILPLQSQGQLTSLDSFPLGTRLGNAAYSCLVYAAKAIWPHPLSVLYPYPHLGLPLRHALAGTAFLALGSALAIVCRRTCPAILVGWLWYLGMLVPVLGIVQSGAHARADRYTYLPLIGLTIAAVWGGTVLAGARPLARRALALAGCLALVCWLKVARQRVGDWVDSVTLFEQALRVTTGNYVAHNNLATALALRGSAVEAEEHYREALRIRPAYAEARNNLGVLLERQGRLAEAAEQHRMVLLANGADARAHLQLGQISARLGRPAEAAAHYEAALRSDPSLAAAHYSWGNLLAAASRFEEAERRYAEAVRLQPEDPEAHNNLGLARGLQGRWSEGILSFRRALELDRGHARARTNLGRALAAQGRPAEAIREYEQVLAGSPRDPDAHFNLGLALQAQGDLRGAIAHFEEAVRSVPDFAEAAQALRTARQQSNQPPR